MHTIAGISTSVTAFIGYTKRGSVDKAVRIFSFADFEREFGGLAADSPLSYAVLQFFLNGGGEAHVVRVAAPSGDPPAAAEFRGSSADKKGLYALDDIDLFNILCLPDVEDTTVLSEALAYCVRRRAFMIIDLPAAVDTVTKAESWLTANTDLQSRNSAAYFPRILAQDTLANSAVRAFPPSGAIAGIYARTDAQRGVWKAPAGTDANINGAIDIAVSLNDMESNRLTPLGLNTLRKFPIHGTVAWGARTLRGANQLADEYKYIPVRRLALFIEESVDRGTKWVISEPNDESLWSELRLDIGSFMHRLFVDGAFQGTTPRDAYFVKCDGETTTQGDVDLGRVNIVVGFAPLKPAEFVVIKLQQMAKTS